jgi:uncharacterized protein (TIGR03435 family)
LTMLRAPVCSALALSVSFAQIPAPSDPPRFEVASIRPSNPEEVAAGWSGITSSRGRTTALNVTLKGTIAEAYEVAEDRILGGPEWIYSDRFQINAKVDQPVDKKILDSMLRTLLAERFKLQLHRETRARLTLTLEVAKHGPKLQPVTPGYPSFENGHGRLDAATLNMTQFAEFLAHELRPLPVVDRTRLTGSFKFILRFNADRPRINDPVDAAADLRFEISNAMQQQLGLELKSQKLPAEMLVIDHAEKPPAN